ncbi:hypothetical protein [Candidatus Parabeggiatoa sp. HSG14]|uniref:hypothetical protein n=1 Tax=Candidatus Parabeggiatoa sp. HSG14 TaxID=3055593 RepID=UPI0025A89249|nr:hypothetical protein [Thiotrichales bacterium HSG14]
MTIKIRAFLDILNFRFVDANNDGKAILSDAKSEEDTKKKRKQIRCPLCGWQPDGKPYWMCEKCFAVFDTFKTHAHCPAPKCGNSWAYTQCIACHQQSLHEKWYENVEI